MTTNERQQRMAERILEDENLRGDLEDDAATALVNWASAQAAAAAADPARTDAIVEEQVQAIRQAARAAALSGETEPKRLIALATAGLAPSQDAANAEPTAASTNASEPAESVVAPVVSVAENATPPTDVPAGNEAHMRVGAASPDALPTPSAPPVEQSSAAAPQPAKPAPNRPRRKRSRLARFYKLLFGGR